MQSCSKRTVKMRYTSVLAKFQKHIGKNGHNFIGLDGDFIMTTHSLTSRITSCSFWLNLILQPYSVNLAPCDFFLFPSLKTKLQGIRFETSEAALKKMRRFSNYLTKNGLHHVFGECCNAVRSAFN